MATPHQADEGSLRRLLGPLLLALLVVSSASPAVADRPPSNTTVGHVPSDTMQVDILFPQEGKVYQKVYPFPVVLAISNARVGWPFHWGMDWLLVSSGDKHDWSTTDFDVVADSQYYPPYDPRENNSNTNIPDDRWIMTYAVTELEDKDTMLAVSVQFWMVDACGPDRSHDTSRDIGTWRTVLFKISPDGEVPDLQSGNCSARVGAITVDDTVKTSYTHRNCPVLDGSEKKAMKDAVTPCPARLDANVARQVEAKMLRAASCTTGSWPDPTGLVRPCEPEDEDSGAAMKGSPLRQSVWVAVILCLARSMWL